MATQFVEEGQPRMRERDVKTVETVGAGSLVEALAGAAAIVLAILGLAGTEPFLMVTISTIVLGGALLVEGGTIAGRYNRLLRESAEPGEVRTSAAELAGGMSAESFAGISGIALGILSLLGVSPQILTPVALIAFGAGLVLGSAATSRLNAVHVDYYGARDVTRRVMHEAVNASVGGQVLVGIGAVVLGILALLGTSSMTLTLAGMLAVGFAVLLSGSAIGAKTLGVFRHAH